MSNEEKMNLIEIEYSLYEPKDVELDEAFGEVIEAIGEASDRRTTFLEASRHNNVRQKVVRKVGPRLGRLMGIPTEEKLLEEEQYIDAQGVMIDSYLYHLTSALRLLDNDNYPEVYKLVCFSGEKYNECSACSESDYSVVNEFVEEKLQGLTLEAISRKKAATLTKKTTEVK